MANDNSPQKLGTAPVGKLLLEYSIPAIAAMTVVSLYHIIDSIFIGHGVGALAIAGLAVTFPLMNLVIAFCTLVGVGAATVSSIYMGQKDAQRATAVLHNAAILLVINSLIVTTVSLIWLDPILRFFGASDETLPYARDFMQVMMMGNPIAYLFVGLNNMVRSTGYPRKAMASSVLSVVVNIVVAPIFIFAFDWGIRGAAWATVASQLVGMLWVVSHFISRRSYIRFSRHCFRLHRRIVASIFGIGLSPFLINSCACLVVIIINTSLQKYGGDMAIGAYGIVNRMLMLFVMVVMGLTQGMQPIIGYNYGANRHDRVKQTLKYGIFWGGCITTVGFLFHELIPRTIVGFFTTSPELIAVSTNGLRITSAVFAIVGVQIVITQFFQSIGKSGIAIFLSLSRQLLFLIPCLLVLPHFLGTDGVWWSMPVADAVAAIVTMVVLWIHLRRMVRQQHEATLNANC